MERLGASSEIFLNASSCSNVTAQFPHRFQCYTSLVTVWLSVLLGLFGLFANAHMIWVYGIHRRLQLSSDQLAFTYGTLDFVSCIITTAANVLILVTKGYISCVFYILLYIMMTRVALYLFTFGAVGRFYMICVRDDEKGFYQYRRTTLILLFLILISIGEMILQSYTGCLDNESIAVIFDQKIEQEYVNYLTWRLRAIVVLDWINWVLLVIVTVIVFVLYYKITKTEAEDEKEGPDFVMDNSVYDQFSEKKPLSKMFKWSTYLAIVFLYPQVIIQAIGYYYTKTYIGRLYIDEGLTLTATMVSDFINLFMFIMTPVICYILNKQFRSEVKVLWTRQIICGRCVYKLCCVSRTEQPDETINLAIDDEQSIAIEE